MNLVTQLCLVWGALLVAIPDALYVARTGHLRRVDEDRIRRAIRRELLANHPKGEHQ
jgi:hypothetical protein